MVAGGREEHRTPCVVCQCTGITEEDDLSTIVSILGNVKHGPRPKLLERRSLLGRTLATSVVILYYYANTFQCCTITTDVHHTENICRTEYSTNDLLRRVEAL